MFLSQSDFSILLKCIILNDDERISSFFQANLGDYSDNQWVTCFQESAEAMLGISADDLGALKDSVKLFTFILKKRTDSLCLFECISTSDCFT